MFEFYAQTLVVHGDGSVQAILKVRPKSSKILILDLEYKNLPSLLMSSTSENNVFSIKFCCVDNITILL